MFLTHSNFTAYCAHLDLWFFLEIYNEGKALPFMLTEFHSLGLGATSKVSLTSSSII